MVSRSPGAYAQLAERYGYGTGVTLVEGCLATAGLPDAAADILRPTSWLPAPMPPLFPPQIEHRQGLRQRGHLHHLKIA